MYKLIEHEIPNTQKGLEPPTRVLNHQDLIKRPVNYFTSTSAPASVN